MSNNIEDYFNCNKCGKEISFEEDHVKDFEVIEETPYYRTIRKYGASYQIDYAKDLPTGVFCPKCFEEVLKNPLKKTKLREIIYYIADCPYCKLTSKFIKKQEKYQCHHCKKQFYVEE